MIELSRKVLIKLKNSCYKIIQAATKEPLNLERFRKIVSKSDITEEYLIHNKHYLQYSYDENGSPTSPITITDSGIDYILKHKDNRKNFWINFISGFISGVGASAIAGIILALFGA